MLFRSDVPAEAPEEVPVFGLRVIPAAAMAAAADEAFGMWSDNSTTGNVPGYVRSLRESSRYDY